MDTQAGPDHAALVLAIEDLEGEHKVAAITRAGGHLLGIHNAGEIFQPWPADTGSNSSMGVTCEASNPFKLAMMRFLWEGEGTKARRHLGTEGEEKRLSQG